MSAPAVLAQLEAAGVRVSRRGDKLLAEPKAAVTAPLLTLIRAHKGELLAALPDQPRNAGQVQERTPTPDELVELRALVDAVATFHGFTLEQTAEAQEIAQADAVAALECFRIQAARIPPSYDDRIKCRQCAHLRGFQCTQAAALGAARGYTPIPDIPRRCERFKPPATDDDQRTGAQRWPNLKNVTAVH
jgi:hypothetical protein